MPNAKQAVYDAFIRKVILADGSEWSGAVNATADDFRIWVGLDPGPSLMEIMAAFNDPEKTAKIIATVKSRISLVSERYEYEGYTKITDIMNRGDEIKIGLRKPIEGEDEQDEEDSETTEDDNYIGSEEAGNETEPNSEGEDLEDRSENENPEAEGESEDGSEEIRGEDDFGD